MGYWPKPATLTPITNKTNKNKNNKYNKYKIKRINNKLILNLLKNWQKCIEIRAKVIVIYSYWIKINLQLPYNIKIQATQITMYIQTLIHINVNPITNHPQTNKIYLLILNYLRWFEKIYMRSMKWRKILHISHILDIIPDTISLHINNLILKVIMWVVAIRIRMFNMADKIRISWEEITLWKREKCHLRVR